ncbi:alpha/beta fold hydrolase [Paucibacter sp. DJ1R-11]|uniref:alpha/beta hydrolase family protein n=1 Tax=Paucibacter sp. DJ1R-11 TaxID=2893556 RepID=UPI0021E388B3|nr:alpha/beta hydrolase [Paucibacter sp. DJ1R-11]MCV2362701.1 alpha/beta fold hydrolase [Paucibacter sp. DJ1R-11]
MKTPTSATPLPPAQAVHLRCADGRLLHASWQEPAGPVRALALISPAMAVASPFYRGFAEWLAGRGYAVLSYDYRGIGRNLQGSVRDERAGLREWAQLDMAAALRAIEHRRQREQRAQGQPLGVLAIGHSFGGQAIGLAPGFEQLDAVLGVAAQAADFRYWAGLQKAKAALFFHALLPTLSHLFGHAPGWVLGGRAQNLPKGAALQWARWGRRRGYLFSDPAVQADLGYHRFTGPVHLWNVTDDTLFGPGPAVDQLGRQFSSAELQRHTLDPRQLGLRAIGHFGMFRRELGAKLWPLLLAPVEQATPRLRDRLHGGLL